MPALLMAANLASLICDLARYAPHGDGGLLTEGVAVLGMVYALIAGVKALRRRNRARLCLCAALMLVCAGCFWMASQIPFCPMCEGGSPLMERLFPKWFEP